MVVANAVAAWIYGAGVNNGMLPGIGEWAGNVPIKALVVGTVGLGTPLMGLLLLSPLKAMGLLNSAPLMISVALKAGNLQEILAPQGRGRDQVSFVSRCFAIIHIVILLSLPAISL